jgi:hypothetical protein
MAGHYDIVEGPRPFENYLEKTRKEAVCFLFILTKFVGFD